MTWFSVLQKCQKNQQVRPAHANIIVFNICSLSPLILVKRARAIIIRRKKRSLDLHFLCVKKQEKAWDQVMLVFLSIFWQDFLLLNIILISNISTSSIIFISPDLQAPAFLSSSFPPLLPLSPAPPRSAALPYRKEFTSLCLLRLNYIRRYILNVKYIDCLCPTTSRVHFTLCINTPF